MTKRDSDDDRGRKYLIGWSVVKAREPLVSGRRS